MITPHRSLDKLSNLHDKALHDALGIDAATLNSKSAEQITPEGSVHYFIPYNGAIATVSNADTNRHTLNLSAILGESREIVGVFVWAKRTAGVSTHMLIFPNEGADGVTYSATSNGSHFSILAQGTNRLQYAFWATPSTYNIYCVGYVVKG